MHVDQVTDTMHAFDVFLIVRFPCEFSDIAFLPYAAPKVFWEIPSGPVEERLLHLLESVQIPIAQMEEATPCFSFN